MPTTCPKAVAACYSGRGEVAFRCVSSDCPAQAVERLIHWGWPIGRMDIDGLGDEH